jgi:hypothetical protein
MLHPEERRCEASPLLRLYKMEDNDANNQREWSFLKDPRNAEILQCGKSGAGPEVMHRIIEHEWLSDEFFSLTKCGRFKWQRPTCILTTTSTLSDVIFPRFDSFFCTDLRSLERNTND